MHDIRATHDKRAVNIRFDDTLSLEPDFIADVEFQLGGFRCRGTEKQVDSDGYVVILPRPAFFELKQILHKGETEIYYTDAEYIQVMLHNI